MSQNIGENIRKLRIERNITQEKLAEYLNVSYQTVSKWENGITLPSVVMLPSIANVFDISIDELYDTENNSKSKKIRRYRDEYAALCNKGDNKGRVELMRKAVSEFPRNYEFMNNLARSIYWYDFSDEVFTLCGCVLEECTDDEIRFSALRTLAQAYAASGQNDKAREYAMKIPTLEHARELLLFELSGGEEEKHCIQHTLIGALSIVVKMLVMLGDRRVKPEERIEFYETGNKIYDIIFDGNKLSANVALYYTHERIAREYCVLGDMDKAFANLLEAEESARLADEFFSTNGTHKFDSKFVDGLEVNPESFKKHWQGSHCNNLYKKLKRPMYNIIRDTDGFKGIIQRLLETDGVGEI